MSDRKYRHRGYQDDDRQEHQPKQHSERSSSRLEGAPRGRGVGLPGETVFKCSRCGKKILNRNPGFDEVCPVCSASLHSCTNCAYFNSGAPLECTRDIPERIENKSKGNRCSFFKAKAVRDLQPRSAKTDPRAAFDALFKK